MNESPKPKGQSPKSSGRFAVEIIARLVSAVVRVVSGAWGHRTPNAELRTSKEDTAAGFGQSRDPNLVHPLVPNGAEEPGEEAHKNVDQPSNDFETGGAYTKSF